MLGYSRLDAFVEGILWMTATGAGGGTVAQTITAQLYQATNSTGGGATAMSSATCAMGKDGTAAISTAGGLPKFGILSFSTISGSAALTVSVGTAAYVSASVGAAAAAHRWVAGASAAATVASEAFAAMFNSTVYNTAAVIVSNFYADTAWATAGVANIAIRRRPEKADSTVALTLTCPSTLVGCGGMFSGHIGIEEKHLKDGCRYVSVGYKSTDIAGPIAVTVIREKKEPGLRNVNFETKDLTESSVI
jgi:hypothetical protein